MDETYIKVKGAWKYFYRAVDKKGQMVDFLLTAKRDQAAATQFFEKVTMDQSGANKAAIDRINKDWEIPIEVRQINYLNNLIEQDHRAIKRVARPMLNFKSFCSARNVLAGIELKPMIRKGQFKSVGHSKLSFAEQFYALAGQIRPMIGKQAIACPDFLFWLMR